MVDPVLDPRYASHMIRVVPPNARATENIRYVAPKSVFDGQPVFVQLKSQKDRIGLTPGVIVATMGDTVRVRCEDPPVDTWFSVDELRVPEQDLKP
jgi:hypothetical protein